MGGSPGPPDRPGFQQEGGRRAMDPAEGRGKLAYGQ